jgi:renalase
VKVLVVGAGISGLGCARTLLGRGVEVTVLERGRVVGGRLASRRDPNGRHYDHGGSYIVDPLPSWSVAPWTSSFDVWPSPRTPSDTTARGTAPMRWVGRPWQRSVCVELATGLDLRLQAEVVSATGTGVRLADGSALSADAVVLAMPDAQAVRLGASLDPVEWEPVLALGAQVPWAPAFDGIFLNGHPVLSWVAHDGSRRGDGVPVLVAHSTPEFAAPRLAAPELAREDLVAALQEVCSVQSPLWSHVHRWTYARPVTQHPESHWLRDGLGICGDAWGERCRVRTAWDSGVALADTLTDTLTAYGEA